MGMLSVKRWNDYYANSDIKFMAKIEHTGLNANKIVFDRDPDILENKIQTQLERFKIKWEKLQDRREKDDLKAESEELNDELNATIELIENTLLNTLEIDDTVNWESLKDFSKFSVIKPKKPKKINHPEPPNQELSKYKPKLSLLERLIKSKGQKKLLAAEELLKTDISRHNQECKEIDNKNITAITEFEKRLAKWESEKNAFIQKQNAGNKKVDDLKESYFSGDRNAVENYCELVLNNSLYPEDFPKSFDLEYDPDNKTLIIEYQLPTPEHIPSTKEFKFVASRKEIKAVPRPQNQINALYDSLIYQLTLRTIHELFEADQGKVLDLITFNGWVDFINKSNGKQEHSCIVSLQTRKEEFEDINLALVDPKQCFKSLKGVGSSKLYGLAPVKPILVIEKNDSRIRDSYDVANTIDDSMNLAEMDWEDFEHLVRELFAKEFSVNGGEVHVTQASRDGGVDAIAFDPDPIRGGKIVIQAKRYSNTVGVSAVRDLFGTIVNEGANKGILVTTATYGPDAYEFAKGKPITLLSGANLLHLLSKHGYSAKIDLKQARVNRQGN